MASYPSDLGGQQRTKLRPGFQVWPFKWAVFPKVTHHPPPFDLSKCLKKTVQKTSSEMLQKEKWWCFFWHIAHKLRRRGGVRLLLKFWARDVLRCQKWYPFSFSSSSSSLPCHRTRQKGQRAKPGSIRWIKGTKLTLDLWKYKWLFAPNSQNGLQWNIDPILS